MAPILTAEHLVSRIATDRAHVAEPDAFGIRPEPGRRRSCGVMEGKPAGRRGASVI
jgi:hypothetical protein